MPEVFEAQRLGGLVELSEVCWKDEARTRSSDVERGGSVVAGLSC